MTDNERLTWWDRLNTTGPEGEEAVSALLDRVEQLERELAAARGAEEREQIEDELAEIRPGCPEPIETYLDRFADWLIEQGFDRPTRDLPKRIAADVRALRAELAAAREAEHIDEGFKLALAKAYSRVEDLKSVLVKALKYFDDLEHGIDQGTQWPWALRNEICDVLRLKQETPVGHP